MTPNSVLRYASEVDQAIKGLIALGLPLHRTRVKNWDTYRTIQFISEHCDKRSGILDVGCRNCPILTLARLLGYTQLYGCDLSAELVLRVTEKLKHLLGMPALCISKQDLQHTDYRSDFFDVVTSISVIEHNVEISQYFREMKRILKPGGYLLTSFDYWESEIEELSAKPVMTRYGPMRVFSALQVEEMIRLAQKEGFKSPYPFDPKCKERVTTWHGVSFTFAYLVLQRL